MAERLRRMLKSGKLTDEDCLCMLRALEISKKRKKKAIYEEEEEAEIIVDYRKTAEQANSFSLYVPKVVSLPVPTFLLEPPPQDADDAQRFYEFQGEKIAQNHWLRLYTEFALFQVCQAGSHSFLPEEMNLNKILVEILDTDPSLELKSIYECYLPHKLHGQQLRLHIGSKENYRLGSRTYVPRSLLLTSSFQRGSKLVVIKAGALCYNHS